MTAEGIPEVAEREPESAADDGVPSPTFDEEETSMGDPDPQPTVGAETAESTELAEPPTLEAAEIPAATPTTSGTTTTSPIVRTYPKRNRSRPDYYELGH